MKLREVSMVASDCDGTAALLARLLDCEVSSAVECPEPPVQSRFASLRCGPATLAVMESTAPGSPIDRYVGARGEGLFSITFEVDDIDAAMAHFRECGAEFVCDEPVRLTDYSTGFDSYRECLVNFTHPRSTARILIELQELRK